MDTKVNIRIFVAITLSALPLSAYAIKHLGNEYISIGKDPVEHYIKRYHSIPKPKFTAMKQNELTALPNVMVVSGDIDGDGDKDMFISDTTKDNAKAGYFWVPFIYNSETNSYFTWMIKYGDDTGREWYKYDVDVFFNFRPDTFFIGYDEKLGSYGLVTTTSGLGNVSLYGHILKTNEGKPVGFTSRSIGSYSNRITVEEPHPELLKYIERFTGHGDGVEFYSVPVGEYWKEKYSASNEVGQTN